METVAHAFGLTGCGWAVWEWGGRRRRARRVLVVWWDQQRVRRLVGSQKGPPSSTSQIWSTTRNRLAPGLGRMVQPGVVQRNPSRRRMRVRRTLHRLVRYLWSAIYWVYPHAATGCGGRCRLPYSTLTAVPAGSLGLTRCRSNYTVVVCGSTIPTERSECWRPTVETMFRFCG